MCIFHLHNDAFYSLCLLPHVCIFIVGHCICVSFLAFFFFSCFADFFNSLFKNIRPLVFFSDKNFIRFLFCLMYYMQIQWPDLFSLKALLWCRFWPYIQFSEALEEKAFFHSLKSDCCASFLLNTSEVRAWICSFVCHEFIKLLYLYFFLMYIVKFFFPAASSTMPL